MALINGTDVILCVLCMRNIVNKVLTIDKNFPHEFLSIRNECNNLRTMLLFICVRKYATI